MLARPLAFASFVALGSFAALASCSSTSHDAAAPPCLVDCALGKGGGGTSPGTEAGADAAIGEASLDAALVSANIGGSITSPGGLAADPQTSVVDTSLYTVTAQAFAGGTVTATTSSGLYSLTAAAIPYALPTTFEIDNGTKPVSYVSVPLATTETTVSGLDLPVFSGALVAAAAGTVGVLYDDTKATVVVRVVLAGTNAVVTGAKAAAGSSGTGPYYDDGADTVSKTATATGSHGTIAFLGVTPDSTLTNFTTSVVANGHSYAITSHTGAGIVSYFLLAVAAP